MSSPRSIADQSAVKLAEREFHDQQYARSPVEHFPATAVDFMESYRRVHLTPFHEGGWSYWGDARAETLRLLGDMRGKRLLDFGCGTGQAGLYLALQGAEVWGFDFAHFGVERAQQLAEQYGLAGRAQFACMDAEALTYADNFFDVVLGIGVLHHVIKYPQVAWNTARVLKPGGRAFFVETLWDNPLINFARRFSALEKEAGDAPLTHRSIHQFARPFSGAVLRKRHLLYMLKRLAKLPICDMQAPLRPRPFWKAIYDADQVLLKFPPLRFFCGEVIVELRK
jgi:2-polyprenyl-3-methyl-5-hydroxy-6-metoxy-1,4-benzoquinol methylase